MTTRWTDNRLDLGALGEVYVERKFMCTDLWCWRWKHDGTGYVYPTAARARRAAEAWMRRALKQASKRMGGGK